MSEKERKEKPAESKALTVAAAGAPCGPGSKSKYQGQTMNGAQAVIASLEAEGVDTIFAYPGGQAIKIFDALYDAEDLNVILTRHEQGAGHMADGYARATGRVGVVIVTSGPGATNTVTAIATAYMDSVPIVVISGQVPTGVIGTDSFQESDIVGITMPIVKHSYLLKDARDITKTFREAFHIAKTGRPGPVLIDIPSDVAATEITFNYPDTVNIPSYRPTYRGNAKQIRQAASRIKKAKRPVLYVGGGAIISEASEEVLELAHTFEIPMVTTLMGIGAVPAEDELNLGLVGMHGSRYANLTINGSDLIIAAGARFSDRVTGKIDKFAPHAEVIHIDIDPAEIGKIREADIPIVGDLKGVLRSIINTAEQGEVKPITKPWLKQISEWRENYPFYDLNLGDDFDTIIPEIALAKLSDMLDEDQTIVTTEVGQHQMWAAQFIKRKHPRTFLSSGGLGTMGFGFPAAIGAAIAVPDKQVICIAGDGSFQMNSQEMATAAVNHIPVKVLIMDNRALGMVRQWQKLFYNERYSETELMNNPDFVKLALAYDWQAEHVDNPEDIEGAYKRMLEADGPYLIDLTIPRDQTVFPMVAPGGALADALGAIDRSAGTSRIFPQELGMKQQKGGK